MSNLNSKHSCILVAQLRQPAIYFNPEVTRLQKCKLSSAANLQPALRTSHKHLLNLPESARVSWLDLSRVKQAWVWKENAECGSFSFHPFISEAHVAEGKIIVKTRFLSVSFRSETSCGYIFICMGRTGITIAAFTCNESWFFSLVKPTSGLSKSSLAAPRRLWVLRWQMQSVLSATIALLWELQNQIRRINEAPTAPYHLSWEKKRGRTRNEMALEKCWFLALGLSELDSAAIKGPVLTRTFLLQTRNTRSLKSKLLEWPQYMLHSENGHAKQTFYYCIVHR